MTTSRERRYPLEFPTTRQGVEKVHDLTLVDPTWLAALGAEAALRAVEARLVAAGAVIEHRQFLGLSAQEVAILVERDGTGARGCPQTACDWVAA